MTKTTPYTPQKIAEIRSWVKDCPTWLEAREVLLKRLSIAPDNVTKMQKRHVFWTPPAGAPAVTTTTHSDGFDVDVELSKAKTLEEVVQLCRVDTALWESKGFTVRRGAKGFAWNARFAKRKGIAETVVTDLFVAAAAQHAPRKWATDKAPSKIADCLYVLNLQDLHLGKLAQSRETGHADWDIKIAERTYREAVQDLMRKAPAERIEEVVVIVGSDMLQIDNDRSETTKGTYVDSDSRLSKVFDTAAKMLTDVIEELASRFKVRVVVIAGNHDSVTSHFLGRYVEGWFRTHANVQVDASPCSRKYVGYGKTLIGFDHGCNTKLTDLPIIMMRENQDTISQYRHFEVLTGDKHHEQVNDIKGVRVRIAPALCSPDKWHSDKGYIGSIRQSQGLLYQRDHGIEAIFYSTPLD
jgi:hypothetical protein